MSMTQNRWMAGCLALLLTAGAALALTKTWEGGTTGAWKDPANWSGGTEPLAGEDVLLDVAATVTLDTSTPALASLVVSNSATLVFTNWTTLLTAGDVIVGRQGVVTAQGPFTDAMMSNRVNIACGTLVVERDGTIHVDEKGYAGGGRIDTSGPGYGPGRGYGEYYGAGGSHGGVGGGGMGTSFTLSRMPSYSQPYGDVNQPLWPGSGGGRGAGPTTWIGGNGGGAIRIAATGDIVIDGTVSANGQDAYFNFSGAGGSGGSVYLECRTLAGNGVVRANGGTSIRSADLNGGSGAGGRIAVAYQPAHQASVPGIRFSVEPGAARCFRGEAEPGTLWFPDTRFVTETLTHLSGRIVVPGFTAWSPATLTISNCWVRFATNTFRLSVGGDLTVRGTNGYYGGRLDVGGWSYGAGKTLDYHRGVSATTAVLTVGGNLVLDGGDLAVYSAPLFPNGPDYGALVQVAGDMILGQGAWVHPWSTLGIDAVADRGSPKFTMRNLQVAAGAGFNADYKGFDARAGFTGYGPGGGSYTYQGGTYGGRGANTNVNPRVPYDTAGLPRGPGSSGHANGGYVAGGTGGGVVWIEAGRNIALDGTLSARGLSPFSYYTVGAQHKVSGGGSGGAVSVSCSRFTAGSNAVVRADGGNGYVYYNPDPADPAKLRSGGGGGGGRIAVWSVSRRVDPAAVVTAAGGVGDGTDPVTQTAEPGTIFWGDLPPPGTTLLLR